jgi:hypothetical protein
MNSNSRVQKSLSVASRGTILSSLRRSFRGSTPAWKKWMAAFALKKAEHENVVEQIRADFRARQAAFRNADTTFGRDFVAMVALSQSVGAQGCLSIR